MTERTATEARLRRQLRDAKKKGPIAQRLERVVQTGLVPYTTAIALGYTATRYGEDRGSMAVLGATALGMGGLALINPAQSSILDILLSGIAASGTAVIGLEHGKVAGRMHVAKIAMAQAKAEEDEKAKSLEADTRDVEADVVNIEQGDRVAQGAE